MKRNVFFIVGITIIFISIALLFSSVGLYTDWLFYEGTGYSVLFTTTIMAKFKSGLTFCIITLLFIILNVLIARRMKFTYGKLYPFFAGIPQMKRIDPDRIVGFLSYPITAFIALAASVYGASLWEDFLLYFNSISGGIKDPLFGNDISLYMFRLPFITDVQHYLGFLILVTMAFVSAIYLFRGGVTYIEGLFSIDRRVKLHLALLGTLFLFNLAFKFYLDRFDLLFAEHGILYGASYTDTHARLPVLTGMIVVFALTGLFLPFTVIRRSRLMLIAPVAVVAIAYFVGLGLYPSFLQSFKVAPNEIVLEKPYIKHHIRFSRIGYGLKNIRTEQFPLQEDISSAEIKKNLSTINNIRLWDEEPLLKTYGQLQQIRTYYRFIDADNDRYMVNGRYTQVMLSPRELSYQDLPGKSWINERLVFTHGIGLAMGPVSGITREGLPQFIIKDIPPVSSTSVRITRPEIYFGENTNDYVIVNTKVKEFSYPTQEGNVYTTYTGKGGIRLSSIFKRLLYAIRFSSFKILLSTDITGKSRILYYRDILQRVNKLMPFMLYDSDPYMVVGDNGRLYWMIDAYTYSKRLPYSYPIKRGINYIRNPVKVVIDAYDGNVNFYLVEKDEIIARTYQRIYPGVFKSLEEMPEDLRRHMRYPRSLIRIQARMFALFHMTDPGVFYNKEDLWEIPVYKGSPLDPYYLVMRLPGEERDEFILLLPFTPSKRDNLAAWMAARCDGENYGKIVVYTFPRDRLVFGPRQIDARIDQNAYISQQLTLWGQRGSDVIRGSLLIIPVERSLIYVQPLYLVATDRVGLPELRRVIIAHGNKVVMEENLEMALSALFKAEFEPLSASTPEARKDLSLMETGLKALEALRKAREAIRNEDWKAYGEYIKRAESLLERFSTDRK